VTRAGDVQRDGVQLAPADARRVRSCALCGHSLTEQGREHGVAQPQFRDGARRLRAACWSCTSRALQLALAIHKLDATFAPPPRTRSDNGARARSTRSP
jgi:hypothetical protein